MIKNEKISSIILSVLGFIIVIDTILAQFFNIGTKQNSLVTGYCVAFILLSLKFPNILKRKSSFNPSLIPPIMLLPTIDLATPYVNPLRKNRPPNVTINEGIFALTTINPWI